MDDDTKIVGFAAMDRILLAVLMISVAGLAFVGYKAIHLSTDAETSCCSRMIEWAPAVDAYLAEVAARQAAYQKAICRLEAALEKYHPDEEDPVTEFQQSRIFCKDGVNPDGDDAPEPRCTWGGDDCGEE